MYWMIKTKSVQDIKTENGNNLSSCLGKRVRAFYQIAIIMFFNIVSFPVPLSKIFCILELELTHTYYNKKVARCFLHEYRVVQIPEVIDRGFTLIYPWNGMGEHNVRRKCQEDYSLKLNN